MSAKISKPNTMEKEKKFFDESYAYYSYRDSLLLRLRLLFEALLK